MKAQSLLSVLTLSFSMFGLASQQPASLEWPRAKITVRVSDEGANPLSRATVRIAFVKKGSNEQELLTGLTDGNGEFTGEGYSNIRLNADAQMEGYYISGSPFLVFTNKTTDGRYQPWNPKVEIRLRKIETPIPVYAKWAWLALPEIGKPCGFDLMAGDWVAPWGKGKISDFVFTVQSAFTNLQQQHVNLNLSFSNPLDGIQQTELPKEFADSFFIWPRQAPDSGYQPIWVQERDKTYRIQKIEQQKFFFRVRTVEKDGKIVSALYGKLSEGFQVGADSATACKVRLCYYLNPMPLDRNMEFNIKRNLVEITVLRENPRRP